METCNFYDTGQRNKFPAPDDMFNLKLHLKDSDELVVDVVRHIQFFCKGQKTTVGKLREFFTDKAIKLYEHDGYITIKITKL